VKTFRLITGLMLLIVFTFPLAVSSSAWVRVWGYCNYSTCEYTGGSQGDWVWLYTSDTTYTGCWSRVSPAIPHRYSTMPQYSGPEGWYLLNVYTASINYYKWVNVYLRENQLTRRDLNMCAYDTPTGGDD
jgi:hypothetical protein